ncbi:hypothetical protein IL306_010279 [Fusarium sp. DS 682]|nr:hypothetical protein IL306_010279 [Fusarium sp. DS 682]
MDTDMEDIRQGEVKPVDTAFTMEAPRSRVSSIHQVLRTSFTEIFTVDRIENIFTAPAWIRGVLYLPSKYYNDSNHGCDTLDSLKDYVSAVKEELVQIEEACTTMTMQHSANDQDQFALHHRREALRNILSQWESISKCLQGPLKYYNPNLILPPEYIPYRGLFAAANMETLYHLCSRLNDLQTLKTFGVNGELSQIQAFDFLRWRLGVVFSRLGLKSPEAFALVCVELVDGGLFSDEVMCFVKQKVRGMEMRRVGIEAAVPMRRMAGERRRSEEGNLTSVSNRVASSAVDDSMIFG